MFRRTPSAPNPHAPILDEAEAVTQTFDPVIASTGDTAVIPAVRPEPEGPSVTTGPSTVVYSALDVTREAPSPEPVPSPVSESSQTLPEPPQSVPQRPRVSQVAPRRPRPSPRVSRRPRTTSAWGRTLRDVRNDPMTALYLIVIVVAAAATCWGTMVAFRPEWVPPAINPRVTHPTTRPAEYRPPQQDLPGPRRPLKTTEEPDPIPTKPPTKAERSRPAQEPTRRPDKPVMPSPRPPADSPEPEPEPTTGPPDPSDPPETSQPPETESPSQEPTRSEEPSESPEPSQSVTQSGSPQPSESTPQEPSSSPS